MGIKFGVAGNGDSFYAEGNKASEQMPSFLAKKGLDAYEYQCGNGVRCGEATALKIRSAAEENNIVMSVHSPYFINLATDDEAKREGSIRYIMQSAQLARYLGAERIVVHSGAICKLTREAATENAKLTLKRARETLVADGFADIRLCIETMGKINQLGTLEETVELCGLDESFLPCIDFGHLNARTLGKIKGESDYAEILDTIKNKLGSERASTFHAHFSKIEYTGGGEKKHLTFEDTVFGPEFEPLGELLYKRGLSPTIICESAGTQTEDALYMKNVYFANKK